MNKKPEFYNNCIAINVLANSIENALDCYEAAEGNIIIGLLSKNYSTYKEAVEEISKYKESLDNSISIGLGAGDATQSEMVTNISKIVQPQHVNQVFTGVGSSRALLGQDDTFVNGLVSPTGKVGFVNIATGPLSSKAEKAEISIGTAIQLLKDMGGTSLKFYPMSGLKHIEEFKAVAEECAKLDFYLEPTGGIDLDNYEEIVQLALDCGVKKIIPHIYSSIIDKETGETRSQDVKKLFHITKNLNYQ